MYKSVQRVWALQEGWWTSSGLAMVGSYHPIGLRSPQGREQELDQDRVWYGEGCLTGTVAFSGRCR